MCCVLCGGSRAALAVGEQRWLRRGGCCFRSPGRRRLAAPGRRAPRLRRPLTSSERKAPPTLTSAAAEPKPMRTGKLPTWTTVMVVRRAGPARPRRRRPGPSQYNDPDVICIFPPRGRLGTSRCGLTFSLRYLASLPVVARAGFGGCHTRMIVTVITVTTAPARTVADSDTVRTIRVRTESADTEIWTPQQRLLPPGLVAGGPGPLRRLRSGIIGSSATQLESCHPQFTKKIETYQ